jgi:ABC-type methionine transport system ATPase subunit
MTALLSLTQVTMHRPEGRNRVAVLDGVSLEVDQGDYLGVYDVRAASKSTLLRVIAGIESPDAGSVCWDGRTIAQMNTRERSELLGFNGIALVSSSAGIQLNRTVVDYVALPLLAGNVPLRRARPIARRVLQRVDATDCADLETEELTLSELMRVRLAAALIREPRLLLIDEPAVLPNPQESERLYELLRSLGRREDLAVLIASQDLAALNGARRVASLSAGGLRMMSRDADVVSIADRKIAHAGKPSA